MRIISLVATTTSLALFSHTPYPSINIRLHLLLLKEHNDEEFRFIYYAAPASP